jgi:hypothetical protein
VRICLAALLASCSGAATHAPDAGARDFSIGGIAFHLSSGAVVKSGGLSFVFSDQPDACLALKYVPVGAATTFTLRVAPAADGMTQATVVANKPSPGAGEAVGGIVRATGGQKDAGADASNGSVAWTANADGSITVNSLDVGFAGTADRLTTGGWTLPACSP